MLLRSSLQLRPMALKALLCSGDVELPHYWSVFRTIHTLNSPQNYICLLGGLLPIYSICRRGAQGLMWGNFHWWWPWLALVVLVDVGCWRLTSDKPTVEIVKIVSGRFFLFLHRSHTILTSDPAAK
jgi:hypothetical protein